MITLDVNKVARADQWVILLLFVGLSSLYFATASGITSSNDGSHYALTRTMVENHHFTLDQFDDYAEGNDIAIKDGRLYSDRPPGTALAASFFYLIGEWLPSPFTPLPSRHDAENPRLLYVLMLPVFAGAGTAVLLYLFIRQSNISTGAALTAVLFFALGTAHWKYSTVLFSHALSSFLVVLSLYLATADRRLTTADHPSLPPSRPSLLAPHLSSFILGLTLGFSVLVEYSNALLVILVVMWLVAQVRPLSFRSILAVLLPIVTGGMISAVFLGYYNWINFGSPFTLSYTYAVNYEWAAQFSTTFSYPLLAGLKALLWWGEGGGWCNGPCYNQGIFLLSPILLLALPGLYFTCNLRLQSSPHPFTRSSLPPLIFFAYLLLFAKHQTFHGFTGDGRYLVPFLGLLSIPLAFFLDWLFHKTNQMAWQALVYLAVYGLFFLSVYHMLLHIGFSYNYHLDMSRFTSLAASPANWQYVFQTLFRNIDNLPLLWLVEGPGLLLVVSWRHVKMPSRLNFKEDSPQRHRDFGQ